MKSIVYVGMDVHKNSFSLCAYDHATGEYVLEKRCDSKVADVKRFIDDVKAIYVDKHGNDDIGITTGYEAGCLGYAVYHDMNKEGIECVILAPTTMQKSSKNKIRKNDRLDARNIAENLATNSYKAVYVPDNEDVEVTEYIRMTNDFKIELKKVKQHINAFVLRFGKRYNGKSRWIPSHLKWLAGLELTDMQREILDEYVSEFDALTNKIDRFKARIEEISTGERYQEPVAKLRYFKGIDTFSAMTIHVEIASFERFPTATPFASYCGLIPGEDSSGDKTKYTSITKQGNSCVRNRLTECAQALVKGTGYGKSKRVHARQKGQEVQVIDYADKAVERLQRKFRKLIIRGVHRNKAITAIARELACFVWGMETGRI